MTPDRLPILPLLLWKTPPGLEMILRQEGVPFVEVRSAHPLAFGGGRFILYDSRNGDCERIRPFLGSGQILIDVEALREKEPTDPFAALLDNRSAPAVWQVGSFLLTETVHRTPRAAIRLRLLGRLRALLTQSNGIWARLAPLPFPYRSAFNLRVDLDEPRPDDYSRFARARRPLADCTTHFVSTHAYGDQPDVLADLREHDTQSHGHFHHVYRDEDTNRRHLERAQSILIEAGIVPTGFAAPHGRWNHGLARVLEGLGYRYSSEFQIGYDDLPFYPWLGGRFSKVLQVPVHPVCEGLFFDAGLKHPWPVADYLVQVIQAKIEAGEPAFVYGHPEGRLARHPEILASVASAVSGESLVWRVTLTEFAGWWHWREARQWSLVPRGDKTFEVIFEDWDDTYPLSLEIQRGDHIARLPLRGPRETIRMEGLLYERRRLRADLPRPGPAPPSRSLRSLMRSLLDWETVTPVDELSGSGLDVRLKRSLRRWKIWRARP